MARGSLARVINLEDARRQREQQRQAAAAPVMVVWVPVWFWVPVWPTP